jgi:hypothetical protein
MDFVERIVLRLREGPGFSRNRHFRTFASPEGRHALRIHRHLRSLEQALAAGTPVAVHPEGERVRLVLSGASCHRTAFLTAREFRLLCHDPAVRAALGAQAVESAVKAPEPSAPPRAARRRPAAP